jgi:serpin B
MRDRIRDLIPPGGVTKKSRLVLANAIYLKAPWQSEFFKEATKPEPFHVRSGAGVNVATMNRGGSFGYARRNGFKALSILIVGMNCIFSLFFPTKRMVCADSNRSSALIRSADLQARRARGRSFNAEIQIGAAHKRTCGETSDRLE